jgi:ATP dependent DNA ligase domain
MPVAWALLPCCKPALAKEADGELQLPGVTARHSTIDCGTAHHRWRFRRDGEGVRLFTRRGHDWTDRYPAIAGAAAKLRAKSFMLDGEAVVCGPDGVAVFDALHRRHKASDAMLSAYTSTKAATQAAATTRAPTRIHTTRAGTLGLRFVAEGEWRRLHRSHRLQFTLRRKVPFSDASIVRLHERGAGVFGQLEKFLRRFQLTPNPAQWVNHGAPPRGHSAPCRGRKEAAMACLPFLLGCGPRATKRRFRTERGAVARGGMESQKR